MVILSPLTLADTPLLERWLRDRDSRRYLYTEGERWLSGGEDVPEWEAGREVYLAHLHGDPVGVIDLTPEMGYLWVSFLVDPAARGRGVGRRILHAIQERYVGEPLTALVVPENAASIHCLQAAGFVRDTSLDQDEMLAFRSRP